MRTYKDYRGEEITQDDCKIFRCTCDNKEYRVVASTTGSAIELLKKYVGGSSYSARFTGKHYISMLEKEEDSILKDKIVI